MRSTIRSPKDFWSGIMFLAISLATVLIAREYPMGTAGQMGPGFFPTMLGWVLGAIGMITLIGSLTTAGEPLERFAWKDMVLILGAVLLFGFLVRGAGLVVAIPVLILVSACGSVKFRWLPSLGLAIGATVFCVLLFVKALGLPLPVVGPWLGA
ncbi:tripartite tricarboxylate transporter TctB family protein [Massilia sp. ZL223]|uniref:tripartite tricarboxylate transporter TctB family protein n=1 Tax=Massilia sp. ZL223 TaxID=2824904 RepID=UPI001B82385E|nr:tripartite tricarboxylate transporter TctB family protein [Massilia sp. ZL223]MBQ5965150.1 tripartite tricarboxylate transporter TctB family protein [Massilia sp. ZL223]